MPPGLGEILAESGDLTLRRLRRAAAWRRAHGGTIERALLETGALGEDALLDALERLTGLPAVSRERLLSAERAVVEALPPDARRRLRALPFDRRGDVLHVAAVDPGNPVLETGLVASTGCAIRLHVTAEPILDDVLRRWEDAGEAPAARPAPGPDAPGATPGVASRSSEGDPFARLARALLVDALDEGAEAVEIGPEGKGALLRSYAGGAVVSTRPLPRAVLRPLLAWLDGRSRPSGPFEEGGILLERAGRRARARLTLDDAESGWLVLDRAAERPGAGAAGVCRHEGSEGDVFCPACGAAL